MFLELAKGAPDENTSRKLRRQAAEQYIRAGYVPEALAEYEPLLHEAGLALPKTPTAALGSLLWNRLRLKLRGLDTAVVKEWNDNGLLPLLYAHLFSLERMRVIFGRQVAQGKMPSQPEAATA